MALFFDRMVFLELKYIVVVINIFGKYGNVYLEFYLFIVF